MPSSQTFHQQLLNAVGEAVIATALNGTITYWNHAAEELYGWTADEVLGRNIVDVTPADTTREQAAEIMEHLKAGQKWIGKFTMQRRDGSVFLAQVTDTPIYNEDGDLTGIVGVSSDITAQKRIEAALRKSEARYRAIVNTAHEGIWLVDDEARTTFVNARMADLLGDTPAEMQGRLLFDFIEEEDQAEMRAKFEQRRKGMNATYEIRGRRRDGTIRWWHVSASPFYDDDGTFAGALGMVTDITERKQYEQHLIEAKTRAEEMSRLKSTFLANMSHEIRTPLTAIIGCAEMLTEGAVDNEEETRECTQYIYDGARRLLETLNSVLDLAQIEGGSMKLHPEPFNLIRQIQETARLFQVQARAQDLSLTITPAETFIPVSMDKAALNRILTNLLSNAFKFTKAGGITITVEAEADDVELSVEDTGTGISKAFLPHLFDEFKQESDGLSRAYEGSGLGLTITKRLVELMEGEISVESEEGKGSTFRVRLPRTSAPATAPAATPPAPQDPARPPQKRGKKARSAPDKLHLLLVEDDPSIRVLMTRQLQGVFEIEAVPNGPEALRHAAQKQYDAVLLDINLGVGMSGDEVLKEMRRLPAYDTIPILAVTAHALPGDRNRFMAYGFDGYLGKPFTQQELFEVLDAI